MSKRYAKRAGSSCDDEEVVESIRKFNVKKVEMIPPIEENEFDRPYDLTPVAAAKQSKRKERQGESRQNKSSQHSAPVSYPVDPWEIKSSENKEAKASEIFLPSFCSDNESIEFYADESPSEEGYHDDNDLVNQNSIANVSRRSTFLKPSDIHPRMEEREDEIAQLRLLAGKLNAGWGAQDFMAPALARRIRDFQFAQEKRRKKYGDEKPWGILGLYDHLASIRYVDREDAITWCICSGVSTDHHCDTPLFPQN